MPETSELLAKAGLAARVIEEIERRGWMQTQAAAAIGVDQPKISALKQGHLSGFSIERLVRLLLALGQDVEISVKPKPRRRQEARLRVA